MSLKFEEVRAAFEMYRKRHGWLHGIRMYGDGDHSYYEYGVLHRIGGPAICHMTDGKYLYFHRGVRDDS